MVTKRVLVITDQLHCSVPSEKFLNGLCLSMFSIFFLDNKLFYKFQSGFTPGHSTIHQLIEIYHKICLALKEKKHICIVICDISKAFDRVWLKGLVKKLKSHGIEGQLLEWLESYISDR